jgi:hypothetical protein
MRERTGDGAGRGGASQREALEQQARVTDVQSKKGFKRMVVEAGRAAQASVHTHTLGAGYFCPASCSSSGIDQDGPGQEGPWQKGQVRVDAPSSAKALQLSAAPLDPVPPCPHHSLVPWKGPCHLAGSSSPTEPRQSKLHHKGHPIMSKLDTWGN